MNNRCSYPRMRGYENYGGRGIRVCSEWSLNNPQGFTNFKEWMISEGYQEDLPRGAQTIDRIDVNGNYSPDNCRLISNFEQQGNTRKNVFLSKDGEIHHVAEWARITGMSKTAIRKRMRNGLCDSDVLTKPKKKTDTKYEFEYKGKQYKSLTEVANEYDLKMKRLSYLIHKGYSVTEAINHEIAIQMQ